jgi:hypothetical protein
LKGRHKDGIKNERTLTRISYSSEEFYINLKSLSELAVPNERIYASVGSRDISKATRLFKERQLAASYEPDETIFYKNVESRWVSCLMDSKTQEEKWFLFDCDNYNEFDDTNEELKKVYGTRYYAYSTKSGHHIITSPFDKSLLSQEIQLLINHNPLMLWAY